MKLDLCFDEVLDRPIDRVWHAITDAGMLARWLMDNDFAPVVGHKFTLRDPPTKAWRGWFDCEVLELDPPHRMVWSWNGGREGEATTRVVFELAPEGAGTRLVLRHEGEFATDVREGLRGGWPRKLEWMRRALGPHYARRLAFRAAPERVYAAVATAEGLRGWWTTRVSGSDAPGGELRMEFPGATDRIVMRVDALDPPTLVRWTALEHSSFADWSGTEVRFDLFPRGGSCELGFLHEGLTREAPCWDVCQPGWDHFLASLVAYVDEGRGTPWDGER
jgi:uncharacterized protein YndB with AHSA1/START domain